MEALDEIDLSKTILLDIDTLLVVEQASVESQDSGGAISRMIAVHSLITILALPGFLFPPANMLDKGWISANLELGLGLLGPGRGL